MRRSIVLLTALFVASLSIAQAQTERCFPETGKCISGVVRTYWEQNGGLPVFGYPITALAVETNADGFTGPTQWFERDRLEDHSAEGIGVLAGRLGAQKLAMEGRPWETLPKVNGAPSGCRFFPETGHSLCEPFLSYWNANGNLARFGYPISEIVTESNASGFTGNFQWFERRRMEAHPENQPPYDILLGLLGNEVRDGNVPPPIGQPTPIPVQPTATGLPAIPTATKVPPTPIPPTVVPPPQNCSPAYPDFCIPPPPPDLDCPDIGRKNFRVLPPDPHRLDTDHDGIGCEA